jgi:uncharacterized protein (TIGR03067 family)
MTRFAAAGLAVTLALGGAASADEKGLKDIAGTYRVEAAEKGGQPAPNLDEFKKKVKVTIAGEKITIDLGGEGTKTGTVTVDSTTTPAHIDITPGEGPEKGKTFPGIYRLEKETLTLVWNESGDRPTAFDSAGRAMMLVLKREEKK